MPYYYYVKLCLNYVLNILCICVISAFLFDVICKISRQVASVTDSVTPFLNIVCLCSTNDVNVLIGCGRPEVIPRWHVCVCRVVDCIDWRWCTGFRASLIFLKIWRRSLSGTLFIAPTRPHSPPYTQRRSLTKSRLFITH